MKSLLKCLVMFAAATGIAPAFADTLCEASEKVIFSCVTENHKIISICSSPKLSSEEGYLQYRFGTKDKVELIYPQTKQGTQKKFYLNVLVFYGGHVTELIFVNGKYTYTVSEGGSSSDDGSEYRDGSELYITKLGNRKGEPLRTIKCLGHEGEGDFLDLQNIVRNEDELLEENKPH